MAPNTFEKRLARLETDTEIRPLATQCCFTIDDYDFCMVAEIFTPDARACSEDGIMNAEVDDYIRQYKDRYASLGAINRVTRDQLIVHEKWEQAHGRISAHA
jgi:hypothetical protein